MQFSSAIMLFRCAVMPFISSVVLLFLCNPARLQLDVQGLELVRELAMYLIGQYKWENLLVSVCLHDCVVLLL